VLSVFPAKKKASSTLIELAFVLRSRNDFDGYCFGNGSANRTIVGFL